jgi:hypothetical protein
MNYELRTAYNRQLETVSPRIEDVRILTYEIINLFLQNEPKFRKSQVNVSDLIIREYELMDTWSSGKNKAKQSQNKPNSNPNKANFKVLVISPVVKKGRIEYI